MMRPVVLADLAAPAVERVALQLTARGIPLVAFGSCATTLVEIAYMLGRRGGVIDWRAVDASELRAVDKVAAWALNSAGPKPTVVMGGCTDSSAATVLTAALLHRIARSDHARDISVLQVLDPGEQCLVLSSQNPCIGHADRATLDELDPSGSRDA